MKKIIWTCGLIGGAITTVWFILAEGILSNSFSLNTKMIFGYASMILAFSLIFVAVKNYRDNFNDGQIRFGKALGIGLLITLIASTVYVVVWMIDYSYFVPDYVDKYQAQAIAELKASGASIAEIQKKAAEITASMATYRTSAVFRIMFTYLEIAPIGILVSLIAALILKRKSK